MSCSTSMSRSSAGSPTAAGGACRGVTQRPSRTGTSRSIGYDYLHVAVDDYTRLAYIEALSGRAGHDLRAGSCTAP